ncbi:acyl-CoA dehydrogenase family protein [Pseudomonas sp. RC10]|uniref:acyl-CoA dehydrogenase family protein n=1 Tax=Pseudomonas TaxID=286 RepID=UPI003139DDBB
MPVDFTLTDAQKKAREDMREFAHKHLSKVEKAITPFKSPEERLKVIRPVFQEMVKAGFLKSIIPERDGGTYQGLLDLIISGEEASVGDVNVSCALFSCGLALSPIISHGTLDQRKQFLTPFLADHGAPLAALAFSEVGGSANFDDPDPAAGVRTYAYRDGDEWVISGDKFFITNGWGWEGEGADLFVVSARTDLSIPSSDSLAVFAVPRPSQGLSFGQSLETMGHRATPSPRIRFDKVRVPLDHMIGKPGDGAAILAQTFAWSGVGVAAEAVCVMRQAFEAALNFAKTDTRNGSMPIIAHQNVGYMLADIKMRLEAARYMAWKAAHYFDQTDGAGTELAVMAKVYCSEQAVQIVYDAMRIVGIESYADEMPFTRLLQDAMAFPLYDGGNMGVRRRELHKILQSDGYDPMAASEGRVLPR